MVNGMKNKRYVLIAISVSILTGIIVYGADPRHEIIEGYRQLEKDWEKYYRDSQLYDKIALLIIVLICVFVYIASKKEKKKERNAVRDIIRTELDKTVGSPSKLKTCENCGSIIGNLEKSYVFEDHVVCSECHKKLKNQG